MQILKYIQILEHTSSRVDRTVSIYLLHMRNKKQIFWNPNRYSVYELSLQRSAVTWKCKVQTLLHGVMLSSSWSFGLSVASIQSSIFQTGFRPFNSIIRSRRSQTIPIPPLNEFPRTQIIESRMIATESILLFPGCFKALFFLYISNSFTEECTLRSLWRSLFFLSSQKA